MALTKDFKETIKDRIERDPAFREELLKEGIERERLTADYALDLRYRGQSNTLRIPWQGIAASESAFHALHEQRYGHRLDVPVEMLNLRLRSKQSRPIKLRQSLPPGIKG